MLAAFMRYYVREKEKRLSNLLPPVLGFVVCLLLWLNLSRTAQIAGSIWMAHRNRLRRLEDARLPRRAGELRNPWARIEISPLAALFT